jgi:glycosidase
MCHAHGIRFFVDAVLGFSRTNGYLAANCSDFFILSPADTPNDPDAHSSRGDFRGGWGSTLFRYARFGQTFDPVSGQVQSVSPGRQLMKAALIRWMRDFGVDGYRLDSIETVANWDFIQEFKDMARDLHRARYTGAEHGDADKRFLVVGEELWEPMALLHQKRLDGLWHQKFKDFIRLALLGQNHPSEPSFEWTVRKAIDCRNMGYHDASQCVIYLTSHDVEGAGNERLFNFFKYSNVFPAEPRIKLAFACLLTAVGVPMILAGDEFADEHDLFNANGYVNNDSGKQVDPVNYSRLSDEWRRRVKEYVSRLVHLRTSYDALAVNDTEFIHLDFNDRKRVLVWRRGTPGANSQVVVVANFSDYGTPNADSSTAEYVVHNWPALPAGKRWREVSQARDVPVEWAGREPVFPWEAKIYCLV